MQSGTWPWNSTAYKLSRHLMLIWKYLVCRRLISLGLHLSPPLPPSCLAFNPVPTGFLWNPRMLRSSSSMIKVEAQNGFGSAFVVRNMQNCEQTPLWRDPASASCSQGFLFRSSPISGWVPRIILFNSDFISVLYQRQANFCLFQSGSHIRAIPKCQAKSQSSNGRTEMYWQHVSPPATLTKAAEGKKASGWHFGRRLIQISQQEFCCWNPADTENLMLRFSCLIWKSFCPSVSLKFDMVFWKVKINII